MAGPNFTVQNTIIAGNNYVGGWWETDFIPIPADCEGTITSLGNNLFGADGGCTPGSGDLSVPSADVFTTVLQEHLADNGGPTRTLALLEGSPAIDAGTCTDTEGNPVEIDQRGFARTPPCDIGAFEFGAGPVVEDLEPPECQLVGIDPGPPTTLSVHVQDHGSGLASIEVLQSRNATVTWSTFEAGTTEAVTVTGEKVNQRKRAVVAIRATDVAGNSSTCDPVIDQVSAEVPDRYALDVNYPNPFNPATTIRFALAETGHVRLSVYDLLGKEVSRLVDEPMEAGTYEAVFEAHNLPSGVYVYRLQAGSYVEVRSMILAK